MPPFLNTHSTSAVDAKMDKAGRADGASLHLDLSVITPKQKTKCWRVEVLLINMCPTCPPQLPSFGCAWDCSCLSCVASKQLWLFVTW